MSSSQEYVQTYIPGIFTPFLDDIPIDDPEIYVEKYAVQDQAKFDPDDAENIKKHKMRIISGYANKNSKDRVNDIVDPQSFKSTLDTYMRNPILRYNHEKGKVIGRVLEAKIDQKGLFIKAQIFRNDPEADRVWNLIVQGGLRGFSIYGKILKKHIQQGFDGNTVKHITEFDLQEIAIVDIPANQDSLFEIIEKGEIDMTKEEKVETKEATSPDKMEEAGNELISSDNAVMKELKSIKVFVQQQTELMASIAETQVMLSKALTDIATVQKTQASVSGEDEFSEDEFSETEDFGKSLDKDNDLTGDDWEFIEKLLNEDNDKNVIIKSQAEELEELRKKVTIQKTAEETEEEDEETSEEKEEDKETSEKSATTDLKDKDVEEVLQKALDTPSSDEVGSDEITTDDRWEYVLNDFI